MVARTTAIVATFALALTACSSSQGGERQSCYPNGTCNAGLTCLSMLCVRANVDAGTEAAADVANDFVDTPAMDAGSDATDIPPVDSPPPPDVPPIDAGTDAIDVAPVDAPPPPDTGPGDTGPTDTGAHDTGPVDSGPCMPCVIGTSMIDHCCLS